MDRSEFNNTQKPPLPEQDNAETFPPTMENQSQPWTEWYKPKDFHVDKDSDFVENNSSSDTDAVTSV